jgi:hypothetical protein
MALRKRNTVASSVKPTMAQIHYEVAVPGWNTHMSRMNNTGSDRNQDQDAATRRANLHFRKAEQAREGSEAWAEYQARGAHTLEKTARLKELRLARQATQTENLKTKDALKPEVRSRRRAPRAASQGASDLSSDV